MDFKEFNDRVRDIEYGNSEPSYSAAFPALIRKVYLWMTFALAISGIVAYGCHIVVHLRCLCTDSHHQNILYYGWNVCINCGLWLLHKEGLV